jgi:peroxiredoxin
LQKNYKRIRAEGAEVIAISSDTQAETRRTIEKVERRFGAEIRFPVLSDAETQTIAAYNVTDPLNHRLARPVTYIINESGTIRWKFLDVRVGNRIAPDKVIDKLKKFNK